jgi:hypothetical protein
MDLISNVYFNLRLDVAQKPAWTKESRDSLWNVCLNLRLFNEDQSIWKSKFESNLLIFN